MAPPFRALATRETGIHYNDTADSARRFKSAYGVTWSHAYSIWNDLEVSLDSCLKSRHLLYAFYFLKNYALEHTSAAYFRITEKTYRTWTWKMIDALSRLQTVS